MKVRSIEWIVVVIVSLLTLKACSPAQKTTKPTTEQEKSKKEADIRPSWYDENHRGTTDSLRSIGYGMAVSMDSVESVRQATEQAGIRVKKAVGDSLETLRREMVERSTSGSTLDNPSFIIKLRNAAANLDDRFSNREVEVKQKGERWIAFARVDITWKNVSTHLHTVIQDYPTFLEAL